MEKQQKVWFITGATAGLGKALARVAADAGHLVIGTSRDEKGAMQIEQQSGGAVKGQVLDITQQSSVDTAIKQVISTYGRIDVLVNNAGYGLLGAVEGVSDEEAYAQMNTNFFGALRLIRAVLPFMRGRESGLLINMSSRLGISGAPLMGLYAASKFALEGLSEALAQELLPFNIPVILVEPGPLRTEFFGSSIQYAASSINDYTSHFEPAKQISEKRHGHQLGDPEAAARIIYDVSCHAHPPLRLPLTSSVIDALKQKGHEYMRSVQTYDVLARSVDQMP